MKKIIVIAVLILVVLASVAGATTLTHKNSKVEIDDTNSNTFNWFVDGVDHMYQQQWFYRINGVVYSLDAITSAPVVDASGRKVGYTYTDINNTIEVLADYSLAGGNLGSRVSDLGEALTFSNNTAVDLHVDIFQYTDWDLSGTPTDDGAAMAIDTNGGIASQWDFDTIGLESVIPGVAHYQIATYPSLINSILAGNDLSDGVTSMLGPNDYTFAWQWNADIAANGSYQISKDKQIGPAVPEASTLVGFGSALVMAGPGMLGWIRRRKA